MSEPWYIRLRFWLCQKTGHLGATSGWVYNGQFYMECKFCNRIVSTPYKGKEE